MGPKVVKTDFFQSCSETSLGAQTSGLRSPYGLPKTLELGNYMTCGAYVGGGGVGGMGGV